MLIFVMLIHRKWPENTHVDSKTEISYHCTRKHFYYTQYVREQTATNIKNDSVDSRSAVSRVILALKVLKDRHSCHHIGNVGRIYYKQYQNYNVVLPSPKSHKLLFYPGHMRQEDSPWMEHKASYIHYIYIYTLSQLWIEPLTMELCRYSTRSFSLHLK